MTRDFSEKHLSIPPSGAGGGEEEGPPPSPSAPQRAPPPSPIAIPVGTLPRSSSKAAKRGKGERAGSRGDYGAIAANLGGLDDIAQGDPCQTGSSDGAIAVARGAVPKRAPKRGEKAGAVAAPAAGTKPERGHRRCRRHHHHAPDFVVGSLSGEDVGKVTQQQEQPAGAAGGASSSSSSSSSYSDASPPLPIGVIDLGKEGPDWSTQGTLRVYGPPTSL